MTYLYLYADCLLRGLRGATKSRWTLALPLLYSALLAVALIVLLPLGIVGGLLFTIAADLCTSSFLYFVRQAVLGSPSALAELKRSFIEYFWPVVSVGFVIFIASRLLGYALMSNPNAEKISLAVWLVAAVLFNAVPEVIYQKSHLGGIAIIAESVKFIQAHWIEWFIPNVLLGAGVYAALTALIVVPGGAILGAVVAGALAYVVMVFRGNLFHELETTSPFQRRMRYAGGIGR